MGRSIFKHIQVQHKALVDRHAQAAAQVLEDMHVQVEYNSFCRRTCISAAQALVDRHTRFKPNAHVQQDTSRGSTSSCRQIHPGAALVDRNALVQHRLLWIPIRNCLYQKFIYVSKTIERLTPSYSI